MDRAKAESVSQDILVERAIKFVVLRDADELQAFAQFEKNNVRSV